MENKVYQIITDRILDLMKGGKLIWVKDWNGKAAKGLPRNLVSKKTYQGINLLFLSSLPYQSPYYLTFNQAKELGGTVKKGEKSVPVVFWKINQYTKTEPDGTTKDTKIPLLRYYNLFNVEQCEGIEYKPEPVVKSNEHERIIAAEKVVEGMPNRPGIQYNDFDRACYNKVRDLVTMPKIEYFNTAESYYSTLFHELAHATGHSTRLNREELEHISRFGDESYSREELTAELTASFVSATIGISNEGNLRNSAAYVQGWFNKLKEDPKIFIQACSKAQRAANYILNIQSEPINE